MKIFKDVVLIDDISKYHINQISEVIIRSKQYENLFGEIHEVYTEDYYVKDASHIIYNLKIKDNQLFGDIKTLKTWCGKILEDILTTDNITEYIQPCMYGEIIRTFYFIIKTDNDEK